MSSKAKKIKKSGDEDGNGAQSPKDGDREPEDDELTRLALEEISKGAKRAKERSQTMGSLGWKNSPIPSANKRYLQNTLRSTIQSNKRLDRDEKKSMKNKEIDATSSRGSSSSRDQRILDNKSHRKREHHEINEKPRKDNHSFSKSST